MNIEIKGKKIKVPQAEVEKLMKSLDLTEQEAIDLWLSDNDYMETEEVQELTKKAKQNKTDKIVAQSTTERKKVERKAPENPLKEQIITYLFNEMSKNKSITGLKVENKTKIITFIAEGKQFKLDLVQKREKKA